MSCGCNGLCHRQKRESVKGFHTGQKYCSICTIYITTNKIFCPCGTRKYRINKKSKNKKRLSSNLLTCLSANSIEVKNE